ncbi:MAG: hypothetical protein AB9888_17580 [Bacteroidales bacterium]
MKSMTPGMFSSSSLASSFLMTRFTSSEITSPALIMNAESPEGIYLRVTSVTVMSPVYQHCHFVL